MFNLSPGVFDRVKYTVPLAALVPIAFFGISLAIGKLPRERPEHVLSKALVLQSPVASPATARLGNAETTIVWAAEKGGPIEKASPSPPLSEIKPENTVSTISASEYPVASAAENVDPGPPPTEIKPDNTVSTISVSEYEVASRPVEAPAQVIKERKPRNAFNEAPRRHDASQASRREQAHVIARHEKLQLMPYPERLRLATAPPERSFPMIIIGVGY